VADAGYFVEALKKTQIGYLAQKMAEEKGVEYIIYQSTDGIVFASRKTGDLLSIDSDPFLSAALDSDTVMHREYLFNDTKVLELVQPFASKDYPVGLLRVGMSLSRYNDIITGYDLQMTALAVTLLILVVIVLLYLNSRSKRREIARQYEEIKSISDRIFDEMRIGVAATDAAGVFVLANAAFERILEASGTVGTRWNDALAKMDLAFETLVDSRDQSIEREIAAQFNEKTKDLLISISQIRDGDRIRGIVAVLYDLTVYRDLQRRSARRERLSEMGNLAAGVAHEIRNPLNAISIAIQRLASEFQPRDNAEEYVAFTDQIKGETRRLNEIITRFLSLTREEQKRRKPIPLDTLFEEFVGLVRFEAEKLHIELSAKAEKGLSVNGDPDGLKQVLMNLFNNSKEAMETKGGQIRITAKQDSDQAIIRFEDDGKGIPESFREKLFTPFFTTKQSGTGLGLSTVYKLVTDMDGEIIYEDSPLGGACFIITLPSA
jgi:signal transduction histidine kinase